MLIKHKNLIILLLIITILFPPPILTLKAKADALPVIDLAHIAVSTEGWLQDFTKEYGLDAIAGFFAKTLVHSIAQSTIQWIRTGGQGGAPLFVQDWNQFLLDAADQASGAFIKELGLTQLCEPFGPKLRLIFAGGRRGMTRFRCTISAVAGNLQNFFNDFNNGGWARWIELTQVNNNPYGTYLSLLEEKERREALGAQKKLNEALSANGFLGVEECAVEDAPEENGEEFTITKCDIVSPGTFIQNRLFGAENADIDQLNLADEIDEVLLTAMQQLMSSVLYSAGGLFSADIRSSNQYLQQDFQNLVAKKRQQLNAILKDADRVLVIKEESLSMATTTLDALNKLKICFADQEKSIEKIEEVEGRIENAADTKEALEEQVAELQELIAFLTGSLEVETVEELEAVLQQITISINLQAAKDERKELKKIRNEAEKDLKKCKQESEE